MTDHSLLLQEHSKLYHYLQIFETETKRKLAMENKRFEILSPLLKILNISSYDALHKQISYELGEAALTLLDIKLDKLRGKSGPNAGEISVSSLKKTEISKINEVCHSGLCMFSHFNCRYMRQAETQATHCLAHFETLSIENLVDKACTDPDESEF